jgi:hypothetical protein
MTWNYRVVKVLKSNGDVEIGIHEVYYNDNDQPDSMTRDMVYPYASIEHSDNETTDKQMRYEYIRNLRQYLNAFKKDVLIFNEKENKFTDSSVSLAYEFDFGDLFG